MPDVCRSFEVGSSGCGGEGTKIPSRRRINSRGINRGMGSFSNFESMMTHFGKCVFLAGKFMDRETLRATVHGVAKSDTTGHTHTYTHVYRRLGKYSTKLHRYYTHYFLSR